MIRDARLVIGGLVLALLAHWGWTASAQQPVTVTNGATDYAEDSAHMSGQTGPAVLTRRIDVPGTTAVSSGNYATSNSGIRGGLWITPTGDAGGGGTPLPYSSVGTTEDKHNVCTAPCTIYSIIATNTNAAARYIRCENDSNANTVPGGETVELDLAIPGATAGAGFSVPIPIGARFTVAATCWLVTGAAATDVAEVAANEIKVLYILQQ